MENYLKNGEHLPDFLKDFHDQKDVFKAMHEWSSESENYKDLPNTWVDNHNFTIYHFLDFMAQHGYKLQKSKSKKVNFISIEDTIRQQRQKEYEKFANVLTIRKNIALLR